MDGEYVKIEKGEIDFNYIYRSSQIPNGNGYPVHALPQWWDDVDPVAGTLYMDPHNGLVYEVQADGTPVAMGFLGQENYDQIMNSRTNPEPGPGDNPNPEPGPGDNPNPEPGPGDNPNPEPGPGDNPNPGPAPGPGGGIGNGTGGGERDGYEYGYYGTGVGDLAEMVGKMCESIANYATGNTGTIKSTAQEYWEGQAELKFEEVVDLDASMFSEKVGELYSSAAREIGNGGVDYENFDRSLMDNVG